MSSFFYNAIQLKDKKQYKESIDNFKISITNANKSLESCQDEKNFDFRVPYDYITTAEFEMQKISEMEL